MRYLITLAILIASEVLYCMLLIGTDPRIIGQVNMTGEPVSQIDIAILATGMSFIFCPIIAGTYLFLKIKLIGTPKLAKFILPFSYAVPWLYLGTEVASFYEEMFGATWVGLEFFLFYLMSIKGILLATIIITSSYIFNTRLLNKSAQKNHDLLSSNS